MKLCVIHSFSQARLVIGASLLLTACEPDAKLISGPLTQRCYAWQRQWNAAVSEGVVEADRRCDGLVLLGCEITWSSGSGQGKAIRANLDWSVIGRLHKSVSLALRVAPMKDWGSLTPVQREQRVGFIIAEAHALIASAKTHQVRCYELQIDYDSAQRGLADYTLWLKQLRAALPSEQRLVITALPSWLGEAALTNLLAVADGYVLQVHSVPMFAETGRVALCDATQARRWAAKAVALGRPFEIALPTYRCLAGYDAQDGHSLGLALDGDQPQWPRDARVMEFVSNAQDMAALVKEWKAARKPLIGGLLWYRMPVSTDARNWRWPTLAAVMSGRAPIAKLVAKSTGDTLVDVELVNEGEAEDRVSAVVEIDWQGAPPIAAEALRGWRLDQQEGHASFTPIQGNSPRLPPGAKLALGWLRFAETTRTTTRLMEVK